MVFGLKRGGGGGGGGHGHEPSWLDEANDDLSSAAASRAEEGERVPLVTGGDGGLGGRYGADDYNDDDNDDDDALGMGTGGGSAYDSEIEEERRRRRGTREQQQQQQKKKKKRKRPTTRSRMRKYQAKLEERRRRMLAGLPRRSCCHLIFVFLNVVAVASCLLMLASQVAPLIDLAMGGGGGEEGSRGGSGSAAADPHAKREARGLQIALRCYLAFFCLVFVLAELECPIPLIRSSQSLHNFLSKGFNYTFVAVVGMEQAEADLVAGTLRRGGGGSSSSPSHPVDPGQLEWGWLVALLVEVPAWTMLGVGLTYMLLGLFCQRPVRDRCREEYAGRMEGYFQSRQALRDADLDGEEGSLGG